MPHRLIQQTALLAAVLRSIFSNTVAGLITAVLLGYWMPIERLAQPATDVAEESSRHVDPVSGKWLDRIEGAASASAVRPTLGPILTRYSLSLPSDDAPAASGPLKARPASVRPPRSAAPKAADAPKTIATAAVPAGPELADAPQAQSVEESDSWMSRWSPAKLTARVAPIGRDLASGVASKAVGAGRAVADRLGGLL